MEHDGCKARIENLSPGFAASALCFVRLRPAGKVEVLVLQGEVAVDDPRSARSRSVLFSGDDAMIDADGEPQILPMGAYASWLLGKMYETPSL